MNRVFALILALMMVFTVACADTVLVKDGGVETELLIAQLDGDPMSWNPDFKGDDYLWPLAQNIFNRLLKLASGDGIDYDLAKSYEFNEDSTVLTFHLQEGVKWHDGEPFTSYDVKWTYETAKAENWFRASSLESMDHIECPDDNTAVFYLNQPDVTIIPKLAWYGTFVLPAHLYEGTDVATNPAALTSPVGTGPYKLESYETGVQVTLVRNDDFWGPRPMTERIRYMIVADQDTSYQAFLNGEADYCGSVPTANVDDLDNDPDYRVFQQLWQNRTYITFNFNDPDFGKVEVRQAIAKAVDRDGIYARVGGAGAKAETYISPLQTKYVTYDYTLPERDIEGAMALLEQAGYTKDANGFYLHATMDVFESGNFGDMAQIIKANVAEAGIDLTINMMEYSAWSDKVYAGKNFSITMLAGYQGPDVSGIAGRVQSDGATNIGGYNNPEMDAAIKASNIASDDAERAAYLYTVQKLMHEDMPMVLLLDNGSKYPVKMSIVGTPYDVPELAASSEFTYMCLAQ